MSIFTTNKPRHFERKPYFGDPRKEALEARVRKAKRELGMLDASDYKPEESIKGSFVEQTSHLRRRVESDGPSSKSRNMKILVWLIILAIIFYFLIK